jgi:hypothetical protein
MSRECEDDERRFEEEKIVYRGRKREDKDKEKKHEKKKYGINQRPW